MNNWDNADYLNLSTQKKNGTWVNTPVWFAKNNQTIYCFSEGDAGKIKRLKNFAEVKICPCSVTGKLNGEWEMASATLLTKNIKTAYDTLLKKYGWKMRILDCLSVLSGKRKNRAFIEITLSN